MKRFHRSVFFKTSVLAISALMLASCAKKGAGADGGSYKAPKEPFPHLGKSADFALLANLNVTNTGATVIYGDVGVAQANGKISGFNTPSPSTFNSNTAKFTGGTIHQGDAYAQKAATDATTAFNNLKGKACEHDLSGQNLGGMTLSPGTYCFSGGAQLDGLLTLDAKNDPDATFIFQIGADLHTAPGAGIRIINDGKTCDVFWQVNGSADLGAGTNFTGGILATSDVSLDAVMMNGKVLSRNGNISLNGTQIYNNFCPWPEDK